MSDNTVMLRNLASTIFIGLLTSAETFSFQNKCLSFDPTLFLINTTIRVQEHVPANTTIQLPGMDASCNRSSQKIPVEACRIALTIPTTNRSSIIFEAFFPKESTWAGRLLGTGNGGIDGCIKYEDIAYGLDHGFAVTGANNGHNGTGGEAFLNNPDTITDFSWRALHTASDAGKALTKAFYGEAPVKSYYMGCSGGGRQGIQAANMFPNDYDGVLVGAPGLHFNHMSAWRASFYIITGSANSSEFIGPEVWQGIIHNEVLNQCDELDGVRDGILVDPALCATIFQPEALLCSDSNSSDCLTPHQVEVVRKVFTPLYGMDGEMIYPALAPGAEAQAAQRLLSGTPFPYSVDWYRYAVYSNPSWNPGSWTLKDAAVAEAKNPGNARTWPSDLSSFRNNGAKMIIYHGGADQQITGFNTERWYNYLSQEMDLKSDALDGFMRFFRVPGMGHCSGGIGAWQIGQSAAGAIDRPYDGKHNVLAALVDWVENNQPPESIQGGASLKRQHCRYPYQSTFTKGDALLTKGWRCV